MTVWGCKVDLLLIESYRGTGGCYQKVIKEYGGFAFGLWKAIEIGFLGAPIDLSATLISMFGQSLQSVLWKSGEQPFYFIAQCADKTKEWFHADISKRYSLSLTRLHLTNRKIPTTLHLIWRMDG